jgi:endoglucanase
MTPTSKNFLFDLLSTPSPTGFEFRGQRKWVDYISQFAERVESDAYGTAWATLEGSSQKPKRLMFEAHADEIGYMVK